MKSFVHLHVHTEYSLLDGLAKIKELVQKVKEQGANAVAITDHGTMAGVLKFFAECYKNGIKPIIGCEFYITRNRLLKTGGQDSNSHIVLLAKNNEGYKNLLKLNSIACKEGFYYKPRIDYDVLSKYSGGLICLTSCLKGDIPSLLLQGRLDEAYELGLRLKNMFADGDFYIELQNHRLPEELAILEPLNDLAKKLGVKTVATNDCHYISREDAEVHDVVMCISMQKFLDDQGRMKFANDEFFVKSREEMEEVLGAYTEALDTTQEIADKCFVTIKAKSHKKILNMPPGCTLKDNENFIPKYVPNGMSAYEFLKKLCYDGLKEKYEEVTPEIKARADYELSVIKAQGFVEYFLIVWDYIHYAREHGIAVGPGRGSGVGSIVAYVSGITKVDPLKYNLLFERFIHSERVSMPDFDIDFRDDRRNEVIEYIKKKYGDDNVAYIGTFGTMAAKNAIRDVARVMRFPIGEVNAICKDIPNRIPEGISKNSLLKYYFGRAGGSEYDKYIVPSLKERYDKDEKVRKIINMSIKLEGLPRQVSTHACGILICPEPVDTYVPLGRNTDEIATQYSMVELEDLGLLKMDILGLRTLTDIDETLKLVKKKYGKDIDFYKMPYDDKNVFKLISSGNTDAVFQLESGGMKRFMKKLQPDNLEDIIAGVALYRPGPMKYIDNYIANKHNVDNIKYDHPCLEPILKPTYGIIIYQEQVMRIVQAMAGYSLGQADVVRRIMGKKKVDKMPAEKQKFIYGYKDPSGKRDIDGALKRGIPKNVALKVFDDIKDFAKYAFNKSHATAYAYLSYQTAYLKCYYKKEFLASVLNNRLDNIDDIKKYTIYILSQGIKLLPPDINKSEAYFTVEGESIRYGLGALKNVGINLVKNIIVNREKLGEYKDLYNFIIRSKDLGINKRCIESMILSGAFDCFHLTRSQMMSTYESIMEMVSRDSRSRAMGQFSLFDNGGLRESFEVKYPHIQEYSRNAKLKFEKDVLGIYLSGHPLDNYIDKFNSFTFNSSMIKEGKADLEEEEYFGEREIEDNSKVTCGGSVETIKRVYTKNGNKEMAILHVEDLYGTFEVMVIPRVYTECKKSLEEDALVEIHGRVSIRDDGSIMIIAEKLSFLETAPSKLTLTKDEAGTLYLKYDTTDPMTHDKILSVVKQYPGNTPVFVRCLRTGKAFKIGHKVTYSDCLKSELGAIIDDENIKFI